MIASRIQKLSCLIYLGSARYGAAFAVVPLERHRPVLRSFMSADAEISSMRVSELRQELKERQVDYSDCFDKESLVSRLEEARSAPPATERARAQGSEEMDKPRSPPKTKKEAPEDDTELLEEIRAMSVKDIRGALAARQMRWAGLLEKEDLVQALYQARLAASNFSQHLTPGQVGDLTGEQLSDELQPGSGVPLLLDVYATWCGPCKMVAPQVQAVAESMGDRLRVAKMDSDKHHEASGNLRVQGLPTMVLFDADGKEIDRVEGAMMKDQILQWIGSKM